MTLPVPDRPPAGTAGSDDQLWLPVPLPPAPDPQAAVPATAGSHGGGQRPPERQLPLPIPPQPCYRGRDYVETSANQALVRLIDRWPDWPAPPQLFLAGPPGSGKTHALARFAERSGAFWLSPSHTRDDLAATIACAPAVIVDHVEAWLGDAAAETRLFGAWNDAREVGRALLIAGRQPPARLTIGLPDLASRLRAMTLITLGPADDALLAAVLVHSLADFQLKADPAVQRFILTVCPRSAPAVRDLVERLQDWALTRRVRQVSIRMVTAVLGLSRGDPA